MDCRFRHLHPKSVEIKLTFSSPNPNSEFDGGGLGPGGETQLQKELLVESPGGMYDAEMTRGLDNFRDIPLSVRRLRWEEKRKEERGRRTRRKEGSESNWLQRTNCFGF